jgi:hypothetical protein
MKKIMNVLEAQKLQSATDSRREDLCDMMNKEISKAASSGLNWTNLPPMLSVPDQEYLRDELVLAGYKVEADSRKISW